MNAERKSKLFKNYSAGSMFIIMAISIIIITIVIIQWLEANTIDLSGIGG